MCRPYLMRFLIITFFLIQSCSNQEFSAGEIRNPEAAPTDSTIIDKASSESPATSDMISSNGMEEEVSAPISITGGYLTCSITDINLVSCQSEQALTRSDIDRIIFLGADGQEIPTDSFEVQSSESDGLYTLMISVPADFSLEQILSRSAEDAVNNPPSLTSIATINATEDTAQTVLFTDILEASDASDPDGNLLQFELTAVSSGSLTTDGIIPNGKCL